MEITGKLIQKLEQQSGQSRNGTWVKQEFILETQDQYPKKVCIALWGDKIKDIENIAIGESLKVRVNVESREYNERWYTDLKAYRIDSLMAVTPNQEQAQQVQPMTEKFPPQVEVPQHPDRVPFDTPATEDDMLPF